MMDPVLKKELAEMRRTRDAKFRRAGQEVMDLLQRLTAEDFLTVVDLTRALATPSPRLDRGQVSNLLNQPQARAEAEQWLRRQLDALDGDGW